MSAPSIWNDSKLVQVLDPAVITGDTNCTSVDLNGFDRVMFIVNVGESADGLSSSPVVTIELEVEDSSDNISFSDAADADVRGYVDGTNDGCFGVLDAAAEDDTLYKCEYVGSSRYARVVINPTGTHSSGTPISVTAILLGPDHAPVNL